MKINDIRPQIETSGQLEEQFFSIQDQGMIFDILRNKMYSNPMAAICREISCNARDAHREVGKSDVPVHIYLPNNLEPFYKVKDFGPGISPERMSNIFIKYTASTKRSDNIQTGGFGLGAKTPFSYSDTFSIKTNYNGKQYNYACFIDESKVGKLALLSESDTTESNGTEIIIPVKPTDFKYFAEHTEFCTRHWDVRPIIKGGSITWAESHVVMKGSNWVLASSSSDWSRSVKLIIDGIEYPLDLTSLRSYADTKLIDAARGNLFIYFGVGELSLSASREQIYLDKPTQQKIAARFVDIAAEIKQTVESEISKCADLRQANVYYKKYLQKAFHDVSFLGKLYWSDIPLYSASYVDVGCPVFTFSKGKYSRRYGSDPNKLTRSSGRSIVFDENSDLFINNLGVKELSIKHVKKAFENNPSLQSLQVVCPTDSVSLDFLNTNYNLDKMNPSLISSITKYSARSATPTSGRLLVYKFIPAESCFKQVSYASIDEDFNEKILCMLTKDYTNRAVIINNKKVLQPSTIKDLLSKHSNYSFYGIDLSTPQSRIESDFEDFQHIESFIQEKVLSKSHEDYVGIKLLQDRSCNIDSPFVKAFSPLADRVRKPDSVFLKRLKQHMRFSQVSSTDLSGLSIYEAINGNISEDQVEEFAKNYEEYDLNTLSEKYFSKYPLIKHISSYKYYETAEQILEYVNLIDAKGATSNV